MLCLQELSTCPSVPAKCYGLQLMQSTCIPLKFTYLLERSNADSYCQSDIVSDFKSPEGVSQGIQLCSVTFQQVNRNFRNFSVAK